MLSPYSGITVDRHQCCNVDRQSFIFSTASSRFLNFDDQNFSKARILQLSKDLGRAGTKLAHEPYQADRPERATPVLLLTAKEPLGSDEPGR
ncbi:hypothetical protein F2Q69_00059496 [Brassica cretica]|uniref:Uncharacterized protein n=1 Tax=Brassica cretica TaxID=69181 RepID=A0A8S9RPN2_BRACR|nr:hypothetical protein F2Q69_00059496 [Brassica cretica]